jgi:hypothetical protein
MRDADVGYTIQRRVSATPRRLMGERTANMIASSGWLAVQTIRKPKC